MNADLDPIMESAQHAQRIAYRMGAATLSVQVFAWAMKHAVEIPLPATRELLDLLTKEDE